MWHGRYSSCTSEKEAATMVFVYSGGTISQNSVGLTHVRVDPSVKEILPEVFENCHSLVEVEFSEGLERIGVRAFCLCTNLKYINKLPSTLEEIGDFAFRCCYNLESIHFPERLQVIGECAFSSCQSLTRIKIPSAQVGIECAAFNHCYSLISVELPEGLQVIGCWFEQCTSLTTVNVPLSVIEIQASAFSVCISLVSLDFPEGLQSIGDQSFNGCKSLESLHIPSTICKMGTGVFRWCEGLRSITLPETLGVIEEQMFYRCTSLTYIEIPPTVTEIGRRAFFGCCSLTHLRVPSIVTRLEFGTFANCTRLISLELPEGMKTIHLDQEYGNPVIDARRNIYGCGSLMNLVIPSEQQVRQVDDDGFMENLKLGTVVNNFADLVSKLQHRFDGLAMHRLCYYQSYYPLTKALENLRETMLHDTSAANYLDYFGMTPFHILALSQTPNLHLFQELQKVYKVDIIRTRDKFGSTPMDYLCLNHTSDSSAVIESLLQGIISQRIQQLGLARWKSDILAAMDEALAAEWSSRRREIGLLYFRLLTYERLESLSMLELALWKVKIDGCKGTNDTDHEPGEESSTKRPRLDKLHSDGVDRQVSRINSGAHVVISNVLPFLDKVCREEYYVAN